MADRAILVDANGVRTFVMAEELGEEDRGKCYICAGRCQRGLHMGEKCRARLTLAIPQEHKNYFTAAGDSEHISFCEYSERAKDKLVLYLDRGGRGKTDQDVLAHLAKEEHQRRNKKTGTTDIAPTDDEREKREEDEQDRNIRPTGALPKNADQLYTLLMESELEDTYTNKLVSEWILDRRTFAKYRGNGLAADQIALVVLAKMRTENLPEELKPFTKQYLVFPTEAGVKAEKIYFMIPQEQKFRSAVFSNSAKVFAVLAAWRRKHTQVCAYCCDSAPKPKQLTFLPSKAT